MPLPPLPPASGTVEHSHETPKVDTGSAGEQDQQVAATVTRTVTVNTDRPSVEDLV
jgi:hypothetical protein